MFLFPKIRTDQEKRFNLEQGEKFCKILSKIYSNILSQLLVFRLQFKSYPVFFLRTSPCVTYDTQPTVFVTVLSLGVASPSSPAAECKCILCFDWWCYSNGSTTNVARPAVVRCGFVSVVVPTITSTSHLRHLSPASWCHQPPTVSA